MKQIWGLLVLLIGTNAFPSDNNVDPENLILKEIKSKEELDVSGDAIVGGRYISIEGTPYLAQLYEKGYPVCGASIISPRWLITAAHCLEKTIKNTLKILTGATVQRSGQFFDVEEAISHENYNRITTNNDIALIKVSKPIEFNDQQKPIKIATKYPNPDDIVQITGFGKVGDKLRTSILLKTAFVPVIGQKKCKMAYMKTRATVTDNMFCASILGTTDSCQGDSGGPAVIKDKLVGIVSWGFECASPKYPGVYTQLLNYRDWVRNITDV